MYCCIKKEIFLFLAVVLIFTVSCTKTRNKASEDIQASSGIHKSNILGFEDNDPLALGNISSAQLDTLLLENYLMKKSSFVLSYNAKKLTPNWVSWYLTNEDMGTVGSSQYNTFYADTTLPKNWQRVEHKHYSNSGITRGHDCPAGDRNATLEDRKITYVMTNIIPQTGNNNNKTWNDLEVFIREEVKKGKEAFIVMGHYGLGGLVCDNGSGSYDCTKYPNRNVSFIEKDGLKIAVPSRIFKVVLLLPKGDNDYQRLLENPEIAEIIAVDTPNADDIVFNWREYIVSVAEIEAAVAADGHTPNYSFFANFDTDLKNYLLQKKYPN